MDNILQDIDRLEAKLNIVECNQQTSINIEDLDSESFDIKSFFRRNFTQQKNPKILNIDRINDSLVYINNIQRETCEQIAVSVDMNLDQYVEISSRFESMKGQINTTDELRNLIVEQMISSKDTCQSQIEKVNGILENYNLICQLESNLLTLKKILKYNSLLNQNCNYLRENKNQLCAFKLMHSCQLLKECKDIFKNKIESGLQARELAQKYNLVNTINEKYQLISNEIEIRLKSTLQNYISGISNQKQEDLFSFQRNLTVLFNGYNMLGANKQAEKIVADIILKPSIENIFKAVLQNRNIVVVATKKEFLEKSQQLQITPMKILYEKIKDFTNGVYKPFADICQIYSKQVSDNNNSIPYINCVKNFDFIKLLWETLFSYLKSKDLAFLFALGVPDMFYINYTISLELVDIIKALYQDDQLRNSNFESESKFKEKWNIQTYFHMRYNEIVRGFEKDMEKIMTILSSAQSRNNANINKSSQELYQLLKRTIDYCLRRGIFLPEIASKFYRLILQLFIRFGNIIQKFTQNNVIDAQLSIFVVNNLCRFEQDLPNLIADLTNQTYNDKFTKIYMQNIQQFQASLILQIQGLLKKIYNLFLDKLLQDIIKSCCDNLEPFQGIPQKYRMTNKEDPSKPSNFVGNIFTPLTNFQQNCEYDPNAQIMITQKVIITVYAKFQKAAKEIIEAFDKSEQLMMQFKSKGEQQQSIKSKDAEKIEKQFKLDEEEIKQIAINKFKVAL